MISSGDCIGWWLMVKSDSGRSQPMVVMVDSVQW